MKIVESMAVLAAAGMLTGCATSSQVEQMIMDANSNRDAQIQAHEESLSVLRETAKVGLEKSTANTKLMNGVLQKMDEILEQMAVVQELANASKVMSAANTVKVSGLEEKVAEQREESDQAIARMAEIDKLYEAVLIRQFQQIADSANAAVASLREKGLSTTTNAPVKLDDPIQIVAPDTSAPTNESKPNAL